MWSGADEEDNMLSEVKYKYYIKSQGVYLYC